MIPKKIHYCWLSGDVIPEKLQKCMDSWKEKLPDYEFILWDLNRFDIKQSMWVKQAFEAKKYAFAADYIRLYAIYHYGGIYLDMDVEVVRNLDVLLNTPYILGMESDYGIEAGVLGCEAGSELIKACIDYYNEREFVRIDGTFDMRPLPSIMMEILSNKYKIKKRKSVCLSYGEECLELFPPEYLTAKKIATGKIDITKNTFTIHHFAGSWLSLSLRLKLRIACFLGEKWMHRYAVAKSKIMKSKMKWLIKYY